MTSFTIKRETAIYSQLISSLLILFFCAPSFAAEDLVSFCFDKSVKLTEAQESLTFLLLPKEKVFPRPKDNCFDVTTSTDRSKLLEKFLRKRYTLVVEETGVSSASEHCQIELKTTKKKTQAIDDIQLGEDTKAMAQTQEVNEVQTSSLLLGLGVPGTLDLEGRALYIECRGGASGVYQLVFSYSEQYKSKVSSQVSVKKNEVINIAEITNELKDKSKVLGLPQSLYQEKEGQEVIKYELQIK